MSKKKIGIIAVICVVVVIAVVLLIIILSNSNKNKITYNDGQTYKVKVNLPETTNETAEYTFVENNSEEAEKQLNNVFADFAKVKEKANIEFEKKIYVFQDTLEYKEKYGEEKANFENFKKYVKDTEINGDMYTNVNELKINGTDAIQYIYNNTLITVLNTDNIDKDTYISIRIYPKDENENISTIMEDEEIQNILNTVKFSKK